MSLQSEHETSVRDESAFTEGQGSDELRSVNEKLLLELENCRAREKEMVKHISAMEEQITKLNSSSAITICVGCKSIRDESNNWLETELFLSRQTGNVISRSICPSCNTLIDSGSYR